MLIKTLNMMNWLKKSMSLILADLSKNKKTNYDFRIHEIKGEIPSDTSLATTASSSYVKNKIPNFSDLVKKMIMMKK